MPAHDVGQQSYLSKHGDLIWKLHESNMGPQAIAEALLKSDKGLSAHSLTGKQVSNWINYQKKSGAHKTREVSLKNDNLKADDDHNCV